MRLLDALAFSSVWVAAAAALLCAAASRAMGVAPDLEALVLAFSGTLAIYALDRLRDLDRDRETSPLRTAFMERHRDLLRVSALATGLVAAAAAVLAGPRVMLLAAVTGMLGLLHRRLKRIPFAKALYIAGAWTAIVAGVPVALDPSAQHGAWVALVLFFSLLGNAVASSVRDEEAAAAWIGRGPALAAARIAAAAGLVLACLAPPPVGRLLPVTAATFAALLFFRRGERYGLLILDGALLFGSVLALAG